MEIGRLRSASFRDALKHGIAVACQAGQWAPGRELFHGNQMAFEQGVEFFAVKIDLVRRGLDQHEGGKFMGAQHVSLRFVWIIAALKQKLPLLGGCYASIQ